MCVARVFIHKFYFETQAKSLHFGNFEFLSFLMKKYLVGVIVATTAVAGYCLYKYFKESPKKRRKSSNNVAKVSLVKVNDILTRLKEGVSVAFASFYPRSILCAIKPEEVEETIETVFKAFNDVIESNMQAVY